ncbi:LegC family aminotransferase [Paenibacillus sp. GCM10027627]|uniref:LegC family aminotransferase n=1 Tax=unclassified Paenibacillus TaxID=185978 RepID=UPI00362E4640
MDHMQLPETITNLLKKALIGSKETIPLHAPSFRGNEWNYVKECLDTGWVSSVGKYVDQFERQLADYTESQYAIAVVNGTAALHISLILGGVQPDDEVLIPSLTFVATANAVSYCGAVPHFVDVSMDTLGMDPYKLEQYLKSVTIVQSDGSVINKYSNRKISAIVPMHTFGHPVDMDPLLDISERYGIAVIEDAAESLGSYYKGRHTGNFGKLAALSFNGNKVMTTGGGGAILTSDKGLAAAAKHLTTTAKQQHRWAFHHDTVGYNYRMPNINAALGCAQLESLPDAIKRKRDLAERYSQIFSGVEGVKLFKEMPFAKSNYWLNALLLDTPDAALTERILEMTNEQGIMTRPIWTPMHKLSMFASCPRMDLSVTEALEASIINIPSSPSLLDSIV